MSLIISFEVNFYIIFICYIIFSYTNILVETKLTQLIDNLFSEMFIQSTFKKTELRA